MRVLVTGAAGQLGTELVRALERAPQHEVLGLDLPRHDLTDRDVVLAAITSWQPDLVLHCAAMTAVDRCELEVELAHRVNCAATRFVADGARRVGAHVVYVSTDYVFDGTKDGPYLEWDTPNPQSVYGRTKLGGELEIDPGWTIARTSWVAGAHGPNTVATIVGLAQGGAAVRFVDDQVGHPTFTEDLAPMLLRLGVERVPGTFHTTNQGVVSWYGLAREVFELAGADPDLVEPIRTDEMDPPRPAARPANSVLGDLAWRAHGFEPARDYHEPLAELVATLLARRG